MPRLGYHFKYLPKWYRRLRTYPIVEFFLLRLKLDLSMRLVTVVFLLLVSSAPQTVANLFLRSLHLDC